MFIGMLIIIIIILMSLEVQVQTGKARDYTPGIEKIVPRNVNK